MIPLDSSKHEDAVGEQQHGHAEQHDDQVQTHRLQVGQVVEEGQADANNISKPCQ